MSNTAPIFAKPLNKITSDFLDAKDRLSLSMSCKTLRDIQTANLERVLLRRLKMTQLAIRRKDYFFYLNQLDTAEACFPRRLLEIIGLMNVILAPIFNFTSEGEIQDPPKSLRRGKLFDGRPYLQFPQNVKLYPEFLSRRTWKDLSSWTFEVTVMNPFSNDHYITKIPLSKALPRIPYLMNPSKDNHCIIL